MIMSKLTGKKEIIHEDVDMELRIDDRHLNEELMDQPLFFRKWTKLLSEVAKKARTIKLVLEETEAMLHTKLSSDGKGRKVKEMESIVALDSDVKRIKRDLIEAEGMVQEFEGIVRAFYQRHEMLKDLAANKRKELL
jgi:hypothetical protein